MKIIRERINKAGKREVVVVLDDRETLIGVRVNAYYRLGQPVEDVVGGHILTESREVAWCSAAQEWV